ncbi:TetR/AcrR family transcriptional regulator [Natronosporangium hydrolyticum]|uniref:TetR/AcrR family transcriptional regulator n=1 Tax=Natronosporangium hydrolyticum TaxID=2811111 RepID=A0A895YH10_9ACTN|nr:TetR/AcrR family transcriptional regulator [Natronosporangium hydrolyticum]QSB13816.1 TetR/AcrR family transcriptional regulator [Natronosporangium hydrolyticum]
MALLWGQQTTPGRGPKPSLTIADIVTNAIELADAEGLPAVSMRNVARRLGRTAMSLYTYVPGKGELLELMLDTVLGELPTHYERAGDAWRPAAEQCARDTWSLYQRHPWALDISSARALLGPHELARYEAQLRIFDDLGLSGVDMTRLVGLVDTFVRGAAAALAEASRAERATGLSDDAWWLARSPQLDDLVAPDAWPSRYPTIHRLSQTQAYDPDDWPGDDSTPYTVRLALDQFEFGLPRLLDGVEAFITTRRR